MGSSWENDSMVSAMRQLTKHINLQKRMRAISKVASIELAKKTGIEKLKSFTTRKSKAAKAKRRKHLLVSAAVLVATLTAGFQHFVLNLPKATTDQLQFTDGIIVMTGGQQRLDDGVTLLTEGYANKMLISGVGKGVNRAILVQELGLTETQISVLFCCVELDHAAQDTFGNAKSAREWSRTHDMQSLRLVTANYHMPRALLIFSRELPHINLYQWPVNPDDLDLANWWKDLASLRLLAREYAKYMAVHFRV